MADESQISNSTDLQATLVERLLDWPFLLFLLIAALFLFARKEFFSLLSSRQIEVEVGGQKLKIGEAVERLDQETDITRDDLDLLQKQIDLLKEKTDPDGAEKESEEFRAQQETLGPDGEVIARLRKGLKHRRYTWRSIERLALEAGVSEDLAHELLAGQSDVKIGKGKSGRVIARLWPFN